MIYLASLAAALSTWMLWPSLGSQRLSTVLNASQAHNGLQQRFTGFRARIHRGNAAAYQLRNQTIQAIGALAAELRAGNTPTSAIAVAGGEPCVWPHAKAAAELQSDVGQGLVIDSQMNPNIKALTACWLVGVNSGSGLALSISTLAQSMREAQEVRVQLEAELAGPKATARMLAILPLIGIGLGYMLGAQPLTWMLSSLIGVMTLIAGVGFTGLGVWWTERISARVEQML